MSDSNKNRKTILLGALIIVVLIGICFTCVTIYAKREIAKPKFHIPDQPEQPSLTDSLTDKDETFRYAMQQYTDCLQSDNTEGSWKTEVRLDGDWDTPFSDADQAILMLIRDNAGGQISSFYPQVSDVLMSQAQDVPMISEKADDILDYSATLGRMDNDHLVDDNRYFLTFSFDPASEDTHAMTESEVYRSIVDELSSVATLSDTQIEAVGVSMLFEIDRTTEQLLSVEIRRDYRISTVIHLTDDSAALLDSREGNVVLPYGTTQRISFKHYGAHFTERAIAVKPNDIKALPADVSVNQSSTKEDYSLTFESSVPDALSFDEDGVMTVEKLVDDPVTVTMTLVYNGNTYTDTLTVYISQWEVEVDEQS